jgi:hypothetical protein
MMGVWANSNEKTVNNLGKNQKINFFDKSSTFMRAVVESPDRLLVLMESLYPQYLSLVEFNLRFYKRKSGRFVRLFYTKNCWLCLECVMSYAV